MSKYTFYEDPGHGWLKVPMEHLVKLGIADKITSCSYRDDTHAYLEEDCDLSMFLAAAVLDEPFDDWKGACAALNGRKDELQEFWQANVAVNDLATLWGAPDIFVRRLPSYSAKPFKHWEAA